MIETRIAAVEAFVLVADKDYARDAGLAAVTPEAAASANFLIMEHPSAPNPIRDALLTDPLRPVDGMLRVPDGPGLGVAFDPARLTEHLLGL
jgi:L-alanine-DL-glutamate epimerase-like enolase superfamily enzyme